MAIAQMYRLKFEAEGYKVEIAANGKLGLELCEEMQPDMVLLDLMMPEMNGDEMLEKMRKADWGERPQVIILTNVSEQEAPERLKDLGVIDYVVKAEMTPSQVATMVKEKLAAAH